MGNSNVGTGLFLYCGNSARPLDFILCSYFPFFFSQRYGYDYSRHNYFLFSVYRHEDLTGTTESSTCTGCGVIFLFILLLKSYYCARCCVFPLSKANDSTLRAATRIVLRSYPARGVVFSEAVFIGQRRTFYDARCIEGIVRDV